MAAAIPGATLHMFTGPGSSHAVGVERVDELLPQVQSFLDEHRLSQAGRRRPVGFDHR